MIFGARLHLLLPGECLDWTLLLKEVDELLNSLWTLLGSKADANLWSFEDIAIELGEHSLQLWNKRLWVCPGLVEVLQNIFVEAGSNKFHESRFAHKVHKAKLLTSWFLIH